MKTCLHVQIGYAQCNDPENQHSNKPPIYSRGSLGQSSNRNWVD